MRTVLNTGRIDQEDQPDQATAPRPRGKRRRGRPVKDEKLVRYSVLWLQPTVAEALSAECGLERRTTVVRQLIVEILKARGRLPAGFDPEAPQSCARHNGV
jgi:hypothetical protein